jgi:hypothetical protein
MMDKAAKELSDASGRSYEILPEDVELYLTTIPAALDILLPDNDLSANIDIEALIDETNKEIGAIYKIEGSVIGNVFDPDVALTIALISAFHQVCGLDIAEVTDKAIPRVLAAMKKLGFSVNGFTRHQIVNCYLDYFSIPYRRSMRKLKNIEDYYVTWWPTTSE